MVQLTPTLCRGVAVPAAACVAFLGLAALAAPPEAGCAADAQAALLAEHDVEDVEQQEASALRVEMLQTRRELSKVRKPSKNGSEPTEHLGVVLRGGAACQEHGECCHGTAAKNCQLFCRPGTEEVHTQKGWKRKGRCARKWRDFCLEDEGCGTAELCDREELGYAGTCRDDVLCRNRTCSYGTCTDGKCVCSWGFTGENCDRSTDAFAFLFYGNDTTTLVSARVLVRSLRQSSVRESNSSFPGGTLGPLHSRLLVPVRDVVAIVPKSFAATTPLAFLEVLEGDGVKIRYTQDIPMPPLMDRDPIIHRRWSGVMNKFAAWQLTEYSRLALLDLDMVFDIGGDDPGRIFTDCSSELCAVKDGDARFLNAGVMVVTPSEQRLAHIVQSLHSERHHFEMPEQSFLTRYSERWENALRLTYLDPKWNSCVSGGMLHNTGWGTSGFNVLHSCSWGNKPPNMRGCSFGGCDVKKQWHTVLVWHHYHAMVDPCFQNQQDFQCSAAHSCVWCGHYCGEQRVPCSPELFSAKDEREPRATDNSEALEDCKRRHLQRPAEAPWADMPSGWWAWPQAALYQVMVDRFATKQLQQNCTDLDDYCGGTFEAMRQRLPYLLELGVDGVLMSPVVDNMPKGYHGYWTRDLHKVNPRLGTEDELKVLVLQAHGLGLKVMVDVNLNHAGRKLEDIPDLKPFGSPEYFHSENFSCFTDEDFRRSMRYVERCQLWGLPDYRHEHPFVWHGLLQWLRDHVDRFGFDGVRVDAARHIPMSFLNHIRSWGAPIPAFHEVVESDATIVTTYTTDDFNALYNYPLYYTLRDVFEPGPLQQPMTHLAKTIANEETEGKLRLNFLDNNDIARFVHIVKGDLQLYRNALLYILGAEGVPVLLYGSEQDMEGGGKPPFPARPPLWEGGFRSDGATFQLMRRVLWLRRRFNGLHQFRQMKLFADHQWLVFRRGPLVFVLSNSGAIPSLAQRVLWNNVTSECCLVRLCNMLGSNLQADCIEVEPGRPVHVELQDGVPKLYVPEDLLQEWLAHEATAHRPEPRPIATRTPWGEMEVLPLPRWDSMPQAPLLQLQHVPRFPRALVPALVGLRDDSSWLPSMEVPQHLDLWHPPVGVPAMHLVRASVVGSCVYSSPEGSRAVYARRPNASYVLCARKQEEDCSELRSGSWAIATAGTEPSVANETLPVVYLTFAQPSSLSSTMRHFGFLVESLPGVLPFLQSLRNGSMQVFVDSLGREILTPVLTRLGVPSAAIMAPFDGRPHHFCTRELHLAAHSYGNFVVPDSLQALRSELHLPEGPQAWEERSIVAVLTGNDDPWKVENLEELVTAIRALGCTVEVVDDSPANVQAVSEALSRVAVLVGVHGAHMTSMLYAQSGTKVVEIIPQTPAGVANQQFRTLAGALDFNYVPIASMPLKDSRGGNVTANATLVATQVARLLLNWYV